jgi:hypothetical protein
MSEVSKRLAEKVQACHYNTAYVHLPWPTLFMDVRRGRSSLPKKLQLSSYFRTVLSKRFLFKKESNFVVALKEIVITSLSVNGQMKG